MEFIQFVEAKILQDGHPMASLVMPNAMDYLKETAFAPKPLTTILI
jgi:hypothetical protein